jgi:hypothetical protein
LHTATGIRLPATLVFDYPNPASVADLLLAKLAPAAPGAESVLDELTRLEGKLSALATGDGEITARLREMVRKWTSAHGSAADVLQAAGADEVFDFIENELGIS